MLVLFATPLTLIMTGVIENSFLVILGYLISGFGMAGIGMGIMHDAIHGAFSKKKWLNNLMANTINLIGANKEMWRIKHNVLHHSFTNIEHHDDDINAPFFLRFTPNAPKNRLHRYQHYYAWFFYGFITVSWVTTKDFSNLFKFKKLGFVPKGKTFSKYLVNISIWKIIFFTITLVLPLLLTNVSPIILIIAFFVMHFVTGVIVSLVFQAAHVMPNTEFPMPDSDGKMENERFIHQLLTTSNFSQKSRWWSWFIGGLTNQVEHHLFPNISHIHYRKIAPIVKQTAQEFGLPYNTTGSFVTAVKEHFIMLKQLGNMEGAKSI